MNRLSKPYVLNKRNIDINEIYTDDYDTESVASSTTYELNKISNDYIENCKDPILREQLIKTNNSIDNYRNNLNKKKRCDRCGETTRGDISRHYDSRLCINTSQLRAITTLVSEIRKNQIESSNNNIDLWNTEIQ